MTTVVKLGGSLAEIGSLRSWLDLLERRGGGRCVVVPGGGTFAEEVRAAQRRHGFSDRAAHRMALLAMDQYALMIADLAPSLRPGETEEEIKAALARGETALWLPSRLACGDPAITASWAVTSDSLAAWLARRLAAANLALVKSAPVPPLPPHELSKLGTVDAAFPAYAGAFGGTLRCYGPGDQARLADDLGADRQRRHAGTRPGYVLC